MGDSDYKYYSGAMGDFKEYTLKCHPYWNNLSLFFYFNIHENVQPNSKGSLVTIPGIVEFYTAYRNLNEVWIHVVFPIAGP